MSAAPAEGALRLCRLGPIAPPDAVLADAANPLAVWARSSDGVRRAGKEPAWDSIFFRS